MKKLQLNNILNSKRLHALLLRQRVLLAPLLEVQVSAMRQEKEIKWIRVGKEDIKVSLFTDNNYLHT